MHIEFYEKPDEDELDRDEAAAKYLGDLVARQYQHPFTKVIIGILDYFFPESSDPDALTDAQIKQAVGLVEEMGDEFQFNFDPEGEYSKNYELFKRTSDTRVRKVHSPDKPITEADIVEMGYL